MKTRVAFVQPSWRRDGHQREDAVSHDKIKAAARSRVAETGESYVRARYEVLKAYRQIVAAPSLVKTPTR